MQIISITLKQILIIDETLIELFHWNLLSTVENTWPNCHLVSKNISVTKLLTALMYMLIDIDYFFIFVHTYYMCKVLWF